MIDFLSDRFVSETNEHENFMYMKCRFPESQLEFK